MPVTDANKPEGVKLTRAITEHEESWGLAFFGYELWELIKDNAADTEGIYYDLIRGKEYTDENDKLQKWPGFLTTGKNPIACYVYYQFMRENATHTTTNGEAVSKKENMADASPAHKMVAAWNNMVELNQKLHAFLYANREDYPAYAGLDYATCSVCIPFSTTYWDADRRDFYNLFTKINAWGI